MISLAVLNLILHKLFDSGFDWADIIVRQMVLWLGFLGGALATYQGRHIAIDAVGKFMSPRIAAIARVLTSVAALVISILMLVAAWSFIVAEDEDGSKIFSDVPAWPFEAIIPVAFANISFHFLVAVCRNALIAAGRRPPPAPTPELDHDHTHGKEPGANQ